MVVCSGWERPVGREIWSVADLGLCVQEAVEEVLLWLVQCIVRFVLVWVVWLGSEIWSVSDQRWLGLGAVERVLWTLLGAIVWSGVVSTCICGLVESRGLISVWSVLVCSWGCGKAYLAVSRRDSLFLTGLVWFIVFSWKSRSDRSLILGSCVLETVERFPWLLRRGIREFVLVMDVLNRSV